MYKRKPRFQAICEMCNREFMACTSRQRYCGRLCYLFQLRRTPLSTIPENYYLVFFDACDCWVEQPSELALENLRKGRPVFNPRTRKYLEAEKDG